VRGGVGDYRAWVLALTYGYCYGVELAADFFRKRFHLPMEAAGAAAACFGAMNAAARPAGGVASDAVARLFGMRGRLRVLWAVQTAGAALCVLVGRMGAAEAPSLAATMAVTGDGGVRGVRAGRVRPHLWNRPLRLQEVKKFISS